MALDCKICCLLYILAGTVRGFDLSYLDIDKTLNPRLIGAVYHLYKPILPNSKPAPITIDCSHPSVVCKFGTSGLVTTPNKECNCKNSDGDVPIISGLTTGEENKNKGDAVVKTEGDGISYKTGNKDSDVPIYKGVVDTDAILNEADQHYNIWNFQRNSLDKGWRPAEDPSKSRVGELPRKFYSYYPFSQPPVTDDFSSPDEFFPPSMSGFSNFQPSWKKPGAPSAFPSNSPFPPRPATIFKAPQFATTTIKNQAAKQTLKSGAISQDVYPIADKVSEIISKSAEKDIASTEKSKSKEE